MQLSSDQAAASPYHSSTPSFVAYSARACLFVNTSQLLLCRLTQIQSDVGWQCFSSGFSQPDSFLFSVCAKYFESQLAQFIELINITLAVSPSGCLRLLLDLHCRSAREIYMKSCGEVSCYCAPGISNSQNKLTSNVRCDKALTISEWDRKGTLVALIARATGEWPVMRVAIPVVACPWRALIA